jgi:hypothetical protein
MKQIFVGLKMAFAELSSDSKARVLFSKQVTERGGFVMKPRPGAFFGKKGNRYRQMKMTQTVPPRSCHVNHGNESRYSYGCCNVILASTPENLRTFAR